MRIHKEASKEMKCRQKEAGGVRSAKARSEELKYWGLKAVCLSVIDAPRR
jgi:hypothetical protein